MSERLLFACVVFGRVSPCVHMEPEDRTQRIVVRASPTEMKMLHQLAAEEGITASDYVRLFLRRQWAEKHGTKKPRP